MFDSIWYQSIIKPPLSPPNWVFAPVWVGLYLLIFLSLAIYILKIDEDKEMGYMYFIIQMALNLIWSPVFFASRNILAALILIILLDIFVLLTIWKFFSVSKWSGILLIPYLVWILFATYLNFGYLILNR